MFNQAEGFNNNLTNLRLLKDNNLLEGARSFNVPGGVEKFTTKGLDKDIRVNPKLFNEFYAAVDSLIDKKISNIDLAEIERQQEEFNSLLATAAEVSEED